LFVVMRSVDVVSTGERAEVEGITEVSVSAMLSREGWRGAL
jgi:hypothetical protein